MRIAAIAALVALSAASAPPALAGATSCPAHFASGLSPELRRDSLARSSQELCYGAFALLHSGLTRTPLWVAERLTRASVAAARATDRVNSFHPEPRLPAAQRAELSDYLRSGYDRGHMAPSGDMPDPASQDESFTLANMIPQSPENNRGIWADIESAVRDLAAREGEVYVVTGPVFEGASLQSLKGRVVVPTSVYKAVYLPGRGAAGAYVAPNDGSGGYRIVSLDALRDLVGIDVVPVAPPQARVRPGPLPQPPFRKPAPSRGDGEPEAQARAPSGGGWVAGIVKELWRHLR